MPALVGILWEPRNVIATLSGDDVVWLPLPQFLARAKGQPVRLAYVAAEQTVHVFPSRTRQVEIQAAFPDDILIALEHYAAGLQAIGLPEPVVERLHRLIPNLELLTVYPALIRTALAVGPGGPDSRPPVTVVVHGTPDRPWIFVYRGSLIAQMRAVEADTLLVDVRQTLGAMEYDPEHDRLFATPADVKTLAPLGGVERLDLAAVLGWFAEVASDRVPRFRPATHRDRERRAADASRRRLILAAGVAAAGLAIAGGGWTWLTRLRAGWLRRDLEHAREDLEREVKELRRRTAGAILRSRQPPWSQVLGGLARAAPPGFQLLELQIVAAGARRWDIRATGQAFSEEARDTLRLAVELRARLHRDALWNRADVTPAHLNNTVGVVVAMTV